MLDTRAAVRWLKNQGYERIGILGTSVGSCIAFLAFAHEPLLDAGTFNHVSGYVADVAWRGLSTRHLREGFGNHLTLEELREYWTPISPVPFISRLPKMGLRPMRFIA
ncbi:MAG: abhydrolase domain-containing 18, partial [Pyrinomonadaceae bacterium]